MSADGPHNGCLHWPARVLTGSDLRVSWHGQRELVVGENTIITPLAMDYVRAHNIRLTRQPTPTANGTKRAATGIALACDSRFSQMSAVLVALKRENIEFAQVATLAGSIAEQAHSFAEQLASELFQAVAIVCDNAGLACCIANKVRRVRAVAVASVNEVAKALSSFGANYFALDVEGRTFFELKQMLKTIAAAKNANCPVPVQRLLEEIDAHR
ncbi:MAG: hypothetical protein KatS3mg105_1527 [Gemmatales bacterium]|nr:MAG: hypothetical protein KatS3mg105_1527 [Gemmatales bacterium]